MKFFALIALATMAIAAPIDLLEERGGPSKATATTTAASSGATEACYNNGCGGNYPWKKDIEDEVLVERSPEPAPEPIPEPVVIEVMEERGGPSKGSATTSSATSGATEACYNNGCGGNYPWKKDIEDEVLVERSPEPAPEPIPEPVVAEVMEERGGPSKGSATTSSATSGATEACYNNGCGGNYPW